MMLPLAHASGSGLTSPPDGVALSLSDALVEDAAVAGASRCAVEPGTSSSWIFRHSAPPSERTGHPSRQPPLCEHSNQKAAAQNRRARGAGGGGMYAYKCDSGGSGTHDVG